MRRTCRTIILLLILSFAIKAFLLATRWIILRADGIFYVSIASHIFNGDIKEALSLSAESYLPFYPVLIAGLHVIIKDWALAAQLVSFFSGWLAVVPFYLLTRKIFDEKIAIISSLVFIVSPDINSISTGIGSDGSFLLLSLLALWMLWMAYEKGSISYAGISIFFGLLAVLTRIAGVVFFPLFFFWVTHSYRNNMKRLLIFGIAIFFLVIFIISLWLYYYKDNQNLHTKVSIVVEIFKDLSFLKLERIAEELKRSEQIIPGGKYFDFFEIARHYMHIIYLIGLIDVFIRACGYAIFPFIFIGFLGGKDKTSGYGRFYMLSIFFAYVVTNYVFLLKQNFTEARYLIPGAVALFPWGGEGYIRLEAYLKERFSIKKVVVAIMIGLVVIGATGYKFHSVWKTSLGNMNIVEAGRWVRYGIPSRSIIVTNDPTVPFSAEKPYINVDCADIEQCMEEAVRKGGEYLIYKSSEKNETFTSYSPMKVFYGRKIDIFIFKIDK